jgi:hypothetical protein
MTQDVKIIGFINCYLFYFLVTVLTVKVNRRLLYCVDIKGQRLRESLEPFNLLSFQ